MAQYRVVGVDKSTGQSMTVAIEAASDQAVWALGEQQGLTVQRVIGTGPALVMATPMPPTADAGVDGLNVVVPFKNPAALIAYYLGLFSVGCITPLGIAALVLGIIGLNKRKKDPRVRGSVHAWIGIVMGTISIIIWPLIYGGAQIARWRRW